MKDKRVTLTERVRALEAAVTVLRQRLDSQEEAKPEPDAATLHGLSRADMSPKSFLDVVLGRRGKGNAVPK
jgi:hypothetical protein